MSDWGRGVNGPVGGIDGNGGTGPIQKQLLAGPVLLAQHHILLFSPAAIELAEVRVAEAVRMLLMVFLPEQLQRQNRGAAPAADGAR
jgi:hypothetical protein